jgi:hypothetical protein
LLGGLVAGDLLMLPAGRDHRGIEVLFDALAAVDLLGEAAVLLKLAELSQ